MSERVLVIGSANIDVSVMTACLPRAGETVAGESAAIGVGGKGANQAAAAALCGAPTALVARTGEDAFGAMVRDALGACGVELSEVRALPDATTGLATICVEHSGQNSIVVVPGANARLMPADIEGIAAQVTGAAVVVLQCETPLPTVKRAIEIAAAAGTPVIFNPAPCHGLALADLPRGITYLVANESEAAFLGGMPVGDPQQAATCARRLHEGGIDCVIITLGAAGCVVVDAAGTRAWPALPVTPVDTTGAGDAFIGSLAASLARGRTRDQAIRQALAYASLTTTRRGALGSYPGSEEFNRQWELARGAQAP